MVKKFLTYMLILLFSMGFGGFSGSLMAYEDPDQPEFELFGSRKDGMVQLYWDCRAWPAGMVGFVLMRSETEATQWSPLHDEAILPAIDPVESFQNRGLSDEMLASLQNDFFEWMQEGGMAAVTVLEMRQILVDNGGPGPGDRIAMKSDFRFALIGGFGFTDNTAQPETAYDYALFAAYADGSTSSEPLATYRLGDAEPLQPEFSFSVGKERITLEWEISHKEITMLSLLGFLVDRSDTSYSNQASVFQQPLNYFTMIEEVCFFRLNDHDADPSKDYIYTLTPVNMFQDRGEPIEVRYVAARHKSLSPPEITMVSLYDDENMELFWEVVPEDSLLVSQFVLELLRSPGKEIPPVVIDTIDPWKRHYIDRSPKRYGEIYYYRLRVFGHYGQEEISMAKTFYYLGLASPPPVTGLTGELVQKGEKAFVHLHWDPKTKDDTLTHRFAIYTDELIPDSFLNVSYLPQILDNEYLFPLSTRGGRTYKFRIAGMSEQGHPGVPGEISIDIGTLYLPRVLQVSSQRLSPSGLLIKWDYPHFPDLTGFNLMMNGRKIAGTEQIKGDMRSYVISEKLYEKVKDPSFSLTAVGSITISDPGMRHNIYLPSHQVGLFPSPASLTFELLESEKGLAVQLCWDPPHGAEASVTGYALFTDYHTPGRLQRINTIPVIRGTEYIYTLAPVNRDEVSIGIAAITKEGTTGHIASVTVPIGNNNKDIINYEEP